MGDILLLTFIFLAAGCVAVPIATRLGLGSVLGYLIAGIAIGPVLAAFGVDVVSIQHFAEFGVVMMLFLVGLELEPRLLWEMRARLIGLGGLQVGLTTLLVMGAALLLDQEWTIALGVGLVLALSSTAIVLQTLNEKGLMKSDGGSGSFSVLLFQDIAVIPMLALMPLLAMPELMDPAPEAAATDAAGGHDAGHDDEHGGMSLVAGLPGWAQALVTLGAIAVVVVGGAIATRPIFRYIAMANLREIFVATALAIVVGIAALMSLVELSPALGAFLAGVVLANSEYKHELESDIAPFKGILLGVFFITVGAAINFDLLFAEIGAVLGLTLGLMAIKAAVLLGLARLFEIRGADRWLFGLGLAQAGEFGFVLLSFTTQNAVVPQSVADLLLLVVAISMLLTPALFILYDKAIAPRFKGEEQREPDAIEEKGQVIIAGHGRFGGVVNRMLRGVGYKTTVLDYSSQQLELVRQFNLRAYFGDATRPDLLHAAGVEEASVLVIAIDGREQATELARYAKKHYPHLKVIARARNRPHYYELKSVGCDVVIRELFAASVRAGQAALEQLGAHPFTAELLARQFTDEDRKSIAELAELYDPALPLGENAAYVEKARAHLAATEAALKGETRAFSSSAARGWAPPTAKDVAEEEARGRKNG